ncbi:glycosyltransferase [Streptomyces hainanensis]
MCTTIGSPSHGRAQLPLLRALAARHEVLVLVDPPLRAVFREDDVRVVPCLGALDPAGWIRRYHDAIPETPPGDPERFHAALMRAMFRGMALGGAADSYAAALPLAEEFRPDLILRDGMDFGACLVAERLGVPHLPTPSGTTNILDPAEVFEPLNATRARLGLPAGDDPLSIAPHGRVDYVPGSLSFSRHLGPSLAYRQTVDVTRAAALPEWVAELATDRPLVLAAIGTALPMSHERADGAPPPAPYPNAPDTLRAMAEAVALLDDCVVVLATAGVPLDPEVTLGPHVHVAERLPQPLLLESVDLFLTHGGFNSVRESLRTATPMVVLPQFGDQYPNARRVEELGLGRRVTDPRPAAVAALCRDVLADQAIGAHARRARLAMLTLPPIETAVADLVKLVAG